MLTKIGLENFKSWRTLELDLSNLTILFGTNSSGKTSVLQSLLLLRQTAMGFDRSLPINFGGGEQDYVDFGDYGELVFAHDETRAIRINLEWTLPRKVKIPAYHNRSARTLDKLSYDVHWQKVSDNVVVDQLNYDVLSPINPDSFIHLKWEKGNWYKAETPEELIKESEQEGLSGNYKSTVPLESCYEIPPIRLSGSFGFEVLVFSSWFMTLMQQIAYLGPLRSYPQRNYLWRGATPQELGPRGEKAIDVLLASERGHNSEQLSLFETLLGQVQHWLIQMELVKDFQIKPIDEGKRFYEARVKVGNEPGESSLMDAGFGISQVLPIITLLFSAPENSIVLIEQPELHLHPSAQAHLADLFLYVAEKRHLQLIVESHSEHLLRRLQRRIAEPESPFANLEHIKMYFCELGEEGSAVRPVEVNQYGQIANWPENFFGDLSGDLEAMTKAGLQRRRQELANDR